MQTETVSKAKPEADLDTQVAAAEKNLERLREIATDAQADEQRWRVTFEREPTAQAHSELVVAAQKAKNALAAVDAHDRDVLQPLVAKRKRNEAERYARQCDTRAAQIRETFRRAGALIVEASRLLDAGVALVAEQHEPRLEARQHGAHLEPLSLASIVGDVNAQLAEITGGSYDVERAHVEFTDQGNKGFITIQINRAATVPATVR